MVRLALAQKISWGTSQFVEWAACEILSRSETVLSGDVPSNCSLASFRHARFFDFFNTIGSERKLAFPIAASGVAPHRTFVWLGIKVGTGWTPDLGWDRRGRQARARFRTSLGHESCFTGNIRAAPHCCDVDLIAVSCGRNRRVDKSHQRATKGDHE